MLYVPKDLGYYWTDMVLPFTRKLHTGLGKDYKSNLDELNDFTLP